MMGDVPHINSLGILTAQNPKSDCEGKSNRDLWSRLRSANYGPIKIKGKFGGKWEKSFLVPHISKEELVRLGEDYCQEAVIWGQKDYDENNNPFYRFEYIENGKTVNVRVVSIGGHHLPGDEVSQRKDFFSMKDGRKFVIPFFDDPYKKFVSGEKYGTVRQAPPEASAASAVAKAEFFIPLFDEPGAELILSNNQKEMTFYSDLLPKDPYIQQLITEIHQLEEEMTSRTNRGQWSARGQILEALEKLAFNLNL
jgi:hypothetical protein